MKTSIRSSKLGSLALLCFACSVATAQEQKQDSTKKIDMDEVIVTGVFDKRTRMTAPVAITILKSDLIQRQVPNSAADLLRNVPGVYVNSSMGEIRNNVSSRGISAGSADGTFAYEYISMQEDGLPVTNTTYFNYGPDFFLRADANIERIDAVRGGPASITAANAPGGIFNYISKVGTDSLIGEIRAKYGVQGADGNSFYRVDMNVGGGLGNNWYYNVGGFYRYDEGARNAGYPMNNGGQFKGNVVKNYDRGQFKILLKYLNDRNGYAQLIPTRNYLNPTPADGFNNSSTLLIPDLRYTSENFIHGGEVDYRSNRLVSNQYRSIGFNWDHDLGDNWHIVLATRYMNNAANHNSIGNSFVTSLNDLTPYFLMGGIGMGTYSFKDALTGEEVARVNASLNQFGLPNYEVEQNNLPNQSIQNNSFLMGVLNFYENKVKESLSQLTLTKSWNNMSFAFGGYFGYSDIWRFSGINGLTVNTLENRPRMLTLSLTGISLSNPTLPGIYDLTNADGFAQAAGDTGSLLEFKATQKQGAAFFGHTWDVNENLTVDWGVRYERVAVSGDNIRSFLVSDAAGGVDGNPFTLFDNNRLDRLTTVSYNWRFNNVSFSGALNYKFNDQLAVYGRYSSGSKSPDMDIFFAANREETIDLLDPQSRKTQQVEMGLKAKYQYFDAFITPFYSELSNVPVGAMAEDGNNGFYTTPTLYNSNQTFGIELETTVRPFRDFNVRAVVTLQDPKVKEGYLWLLNELGIEDDEIFSYSGTTVAYTPKVMMNITPSYSYKKAYAFLTWSYMGQKEGSNLNIYKLPAFSQFDLGVGYDVNKKLGILLNINNLFDYYGVMSYQRPGTLQQQLQGFESFTQAEYEAAIANDTPYFTIAIPPRSSFLTVSYRF